MNVLVLPRRNRDDVLQECLVGAVVGVRERRYRPAPGLDPTYALPRWLVDIAGHQASQ